MDGYMGRWMTDRNPDFVLFRLNHTKLLSSLFKNDKILHFTQAKVFGGGKGTSRCLQLTWKCTRNREDLRVASGVDGW